MTGSNFGWSTNWVVSGASLSGPVVTFSGSSKTYVAYLRTASGDERTVTYWVTNVCD